MEHVSCDFRKISRQSGGRRDATFSRHEKGFLKDKGQKSAKKINGIHGNTKILSAKGMLFDPLLYGAVKLGESTLRLLNRLSLLPKGGRGGGDSKKPVFVENNLSQEAKERPALFVYKRRDKNNNLLLRKKMKEEKTGLGQEKEMSEKYQS